MCKKITGQYVKNFPGVAKKTVSNLQVDVKNLLPNYVLRTFFKNVLKKP
jgi:hypothetical protein